MGLRKSTLGGWSWGGPSTDTGKLSQEEQALGGHVPGRNTAGKGGLINLNGDEEIIEQGTDYRIIKP